MPGLWYCRKLGLPGEQVKCAPAPGWQPLALWQLAGVNLLVALAVHQRQVDSLHQGWHILNTVTWYKPNASPNLACRQFTHSTELLIWAAPARGKKLAHTFNYRDMKAQNGGKQMRDVWALAAEGDHEEWVTGEGEHRMWRLPVPGKTEKREGHHPTQKPLALLDRIVQSASSSGDVVLDPFNGSGTTGVAAVGRGRRYVGIDRDAGYLDLTSRRLARLGRTDD